MKTYLALGLMSGTSMDGIDAALMVTDGQREIKNLGFLSKPYTNDFQQKLKIAEFALHQTKGNLQLAEKNFVHYAHSYLNGTIKVSKDFLNLSNPIQDLMVESTNYHAEAANALLTKLKLENNSVNVIGYHGQTFYHAPQEGISLQMGYPRQLAQATSIDVVYNFRENDIQNGGAGAPLAPIYHQALAQKYNLSPCVFVNCGGISNLSYIPCAKNPKQEIIAFDIGPGNALLDKLVQKQTGEQQRMDKNGQYSMMGKVNKEMLAVLEEESCQIRDFYTLKPPKSLDINNLQLPKCFLQAPLEDAARTLAHFTVKCIQDALGFLPINDQPLTWVLVGGGWHNPTLKLEFANSLRQQDRILDLKSIDLFENAIEAQAFAYLAVRNLQKLPLSFPTTTGVNKPCIGGQIERVVSIH